MAGFANSLRMVKPGHPMKAGQKCKDTEISGNGNMLTTAFAAGENTRKIEV